MAAEEPETIIPVNPDEEAVQVRQVSGQAGRSLRLAGSCTCVNQQRNPPLTGVGPPASPALWQVWRAARAWSRELRGLVRSARHVNDTGGAIPPSSTQECLAELARLPPLATTGGDTGQVRPLGAPHSPDRVAEQACPLPKPDGGTRFPPLSRRTRWPRPQVALRALRCATLPIVACYHLSVGALYC